VVVLVLVVVLVVVVVGAAVVVVVVVRREIVPSSSQHTSGGKYVASILNSTSIRVSPFATFIQSKSCPLYITQVESIVTPSQGSTGSHVVSPVTPGGVQIAQGSHLGLAMLQLQDIFLIY
jgi:hypothetical protein